LSQLVVSHVDHPTIKKDVFCLSRSIRSRISVRVVTRQSNQVVALLVTF